MWIPTENGGRVHAVGYFVNLYMSEFEIQKLYIEATKAAPAIALNCISYFNLAYTDRSGDVTICCRCCKDGSGYETRLCQLSQLKMKVIVIGAGFAGVGAASLLSPKTDVTVLEGGSYIGGRARTITLQSGEEEEDAGRKGPGHNRKYLELGCTFLHGSKGNALHALAVQHHVIDDVAAERDGSLGRGRRLPKVVNVLSSGETLSEEVVDRYWELYYKVQRETVRRSKAKDWTLLHPASGEPVAEGKEMPPPPPLPPSRADLSSYLAERLRELVVSSEPDAHAGDDDAVVSGASMRPIIEHILREEGLDNGTKMSEGVDLLSYGDYDLSEEGLEDCAIVVRGGYSTIISAAAKGIPPSSFRLGSKVERITWSPSSMPMSHHVVTMATTAPHATGGERLPIQVICANGEVHEADHVIVTVSLGVLQGQRDLFDPPLPRWKQAAVDSLSMGVVNKVALQFRGPLVEEDHEAISFFWREEDRDHPSIPPWARCQSKVDRLAGSNIYTAWFCGEDAFAVEGLTDSDLVSGMVSVLELFLKRVVERPTVVGRSAWGGDGLFFGSYSYNPHGTNKEDRVTLSKPLDGTTPLQILFAGEATHPTLFSTTHGAYESGQREAKRLLSLYGKEH